MTTPELVQKEFEARLKALLQEFGGDTGCAEIATEANGRVWVFIPAKFEGKTMVRANAHFALPKWIMGQDLLLHD